MALFGQAEIPLKPLEQDEIDRARAAFNRFDKDGGGTIDTSELRATLQALGQNPSDEELFIMISQVDDDNSGEIEFSEFLKVIQQQKSLQARAEDDSDTLEAFVALGGSYDRTGEVSTEKLRTTIKEFGLTIDIDGLIKEADTDGSGYIDYKEFKKLLS